MPVLRSIRVKMGLKLAEKFGITKEMIEKRKEEFISWLSERGLQPSWESYLAFIKDTRGEANLIDWVVGIILLSVLGIGVAIPTVISTVNQILPNVSGINATLLGVVPTFVIIVIILMVLGRR